MSNINEIPQGSVPDDHILSKTFCLSLFHLRALFSKIKFLAKISIDLCNFYSKVIFFNFI